MDIGISVKLQFIEEEFLKKLKDIGYTHIDVNMDVVIDSKCSLTMGDKELVDFVSEKYALLKKYGFKIFQTHTACTWEVRSKTELLNLVRSNKRTIELTKILGCNCMVIHPIRYSVFLEKAFKDKYELNKFFLTEMLNEAEKLGVYLALENFPLDVGDTIEEHLKLLDLVKSKYLVTCFDTGHSFFAQNDLYDHIIALKDTLKVVHIHDNYGFDDNHNPIGLGRITWERVMSALKTVGFKGVFSLEPAYRYSIGTKSSDAEILLHYITAKELLEKYPL